jgi:hypothetical protein
MQHPPSPCRPTHTHMHALQPRHLQQRARMRIAGSQPLLPHPRMNHHRQQSARKVRRVRRRSELQHPEGKVPAMRPHQDCLHQQTPWTAPLQLGHSSPDPQPLSPPHPPMCQLTPPPPTPPHNHPTNTHYPGSCSPDQRRVSLLHPPRRPGQHLPHPPCPHQRCDDVEEGTRDVVVGVAKRSKHSVEEMEELKGGG